ncbi:MAG: hypothetical protein LBD29_06395 [Treponema sp.]|nr:hypothetical protein [Treponema sp.]
MGAALSFGLILTGCEQPTEYTVNEGLASIPGPGNLEAKIHDGVIYLTWDSVANASGYRIVRKDNETEITKVLNDNMVNTGSGSLWHGDIVGWDNQLVHDRTYTYTVISLNTAGINKSVLSGESSVEATAQIPGRTAFSLGDAPVIAVEREPDANFILVTFPTKPNLRYDVSYVYGTGSIVAQLTGGPSGSESGGDLSNPTRAVRFPLIGGNNTVSVKASFVGGENYYNQTAVTPKPADFVISGLDNITSFTAVRTGARVDFTWNNVSGATGYKIYKAQTSSFTGDPASMIAPITVQSNWIQISPTIGPVNENGTWKAAYSETGPASWSGNYIYVLIAEGANNNKSNPAFKSVSEADFNAPALNISPVWYSGVGAQALYDVTISWDADGSDTYTLLYAQAASLGYNPSTGEYDVVNSLEGNYASLTIPPSVLGTSLRTVTVRLPYGGEYAFKLVARRGGVEDHTIKGVRVN